MKEKKKTTQIIERFAEQVSLDELTQKLADLFVIQLDEIHAKATAEREKHTSNHPPPRDGP